MNIKQKLNRLDGIGSILTDSSLLDRYSKDQDHQGATPAAIIFPKDTSEVRAIVKWANEEIVPLTIISSLAGPRRRGDTVLTKEGVVVDLSRMSKIRFIDGQEKMAIVEPGVTFEQLNHSLKSHGLRAYTPLRPRAGKSVLTTYLDREPITCPRDHWDVTDPLGGIEIVMGGGELFHTGGAAWGKDLDSILESGMRPTASIGPLATDYTRVIQGSQGTLGIVTWATVMCEPIPAIEQSYVVASDDLEPLTKLSARLTRARYGSDLLIVDRTRLEALGIPSANIDANAPRWLLYVSLVAPNYLPEKRIAFERNDLDQYAADLALSVSDSWSGISVSVIREAMKASTETDYKADCLGSYKDVFFRSQMTKSAGFVEKIESALSELKSSDVRASFYIQPTVQGVTCHFELTLHFANDDAIQKKAGKFCLDLSRNLIKQGAFFDRPYGDTSTLVYECDTQIVQSLNVVKEMMDPKKILNPGKLCY